MLLTVLMLTFTALAEGAQDPTAKFPLYGEAGTAESPYLIKTIDDLNTLSADVNRGIDYHGMYFKLESDLDYSGETVDGGSNFAPIGWAINSSNVPNDFQGNFDGGDHTISGVKVEDNTHDFCGLFGRVKNGTIKNLKVTNSSFSSSCSDNGVGGIVGAAYNSTVENCHTTGDVTSNYAAGGIAGIILDDAKIIACTSAAAVSGEYVGGILGYYNPAGGSMQYCFYYGSSVTKSGSGYGALYGNTAPCPLDCYYQSTVWGAYSGMDIETSQHGYTITLADGIAMSGYDTEADRTITLPSGDKLKIYNDGYEYLGQRYFRYGATVTLSDNQEVDDGYTPGGYVNTDGAMGPPVSKYDDDTQQTYPSSLSGSTLTMGTCDVTISMASKTPITYNITYDLADGTVTTANPATYNVETDDFTLTNPTKAGYTFAGWTGTGLTEATMTVTIPKGSLGDRTYTATWTITTYNITYDLAGGTVATANPTSYTVETNDFTLNNPTRSGYDFQGWHGTGVDVVSTTVTVAKGSTGNRTYTAHWVVSGSGVSDNWSGNAAASFSNISGTTINITSEAELALLAMNVNSGTNYSGYTVNLTKDLDLRGYYWVAIGNDHSENNMFKGTFNGQGHTISGVIISTGNFQGLFGYIGEGGKVEGVKLTDSNISGGSNIGGIAGACDGTIENCHVAADVTLTLKATGYNIGGIAGYSDGTVAYCTSAATISSASETNYKGGVIGGAVTSATIVNNCLYYGDGLSALDGSITGQKVDNNRVTNCYHTTTQQGNGGTSEEGCKFVRVYDADPGIMGTVTKEYSDTGYKVYEKGVSYGGKFYTAFVALTEDGTTDLTAYAGQAIDVGLAGRTLYRDGYWNTLCLPFDVTVGSDVMADATAMTLNTSTSGFNESTGELTLYFDDAPTTIPAGTPFIVKWGNKGSHPDTDITDPVFSGVTISSTTPTLIKSTDTNVGFIGNYNRVTLTGGDASNLYLGVKDGKNTLFWPSTNKTINAFRAYFHVDLDGGSVSAIQMYFGDDETTGIITMSDVRSKMSDVWYTLDGRKLDGKPTQKGIYIYNGKKVVIK